MHEHDLGGLGVKILFGLNYHVACLLNKADSKAELSLWRDGEFMVIAVTP
jgi:hypothetical protein